MWDIDSLENLEIMNDKKEGNYLHITFTKGTSPVPEFNLFIDDIATWEAILKKEKRRIEYHSNEFTVEVASLLKTQSETSFEEIKELAISSYGYEEFTDDDVVKLLRGMITELDDIEGFVEKGKRRFIHKAKFERMRENININTNFDMNKNATILIRCPYCGGPTPDELPSSTVVCPSCNNTYLIPKRLYDIL